MFLSICSKTVKTESHGVRKKFCFSHVSIFLAGICLVIKSSGILKLSSLTGYSIIYRFHFQRFYYFNIGILKYENGEKRKKEIICPLWKYLFTEKALYIKSKVTNF